VVYDQGSFCTVLAGPELRDALRRGYVARVYRLGVYDVAEIFKSYVEELYGYRLVAKWGGDKFNDLFYKLLLNSLYGKFAQKNPKWVEDVNLEVELNSYAWLKRGGELIMARNIGGRKEYLAGKEPVWHYMPAIASFVTSYARAYLNRLFDIAGIDNVYYSDTDSLIVNEEGYERLKEHIDSVRLGALKVEDEAEELEIIAKKNYRLGDTVKRAGISDRAIVLGDGMFLDWRIESAITAMRLGHKGYLEERLVPIRFWGQ
ncbi:MAG: hypothetical protein C4291_15765, partial [Candidatus Dadabacteria bacterium]